MLEWTQEQRCSSSSNMSPVTVPTGR